MDIQELAKEVLAQFETKFRDGGRPFKVLKEDVPDWIADLCRAAHGDMLPDDERYDLIQDVVQSLVDHDSTDDARDSLEPDTYNMDRLQWLASHLGRADYVNQAINDGVIDVSSEFNLMDVIGAGQIIEMQQVFDSVLDSLEARLSDVE